MHRSTILTVLALLLAATVCSAGPSVEIIDYGIIDAEITSTVNADNTAAGERDLVDKFAIVQTTRTIPIRSGLKFGFTYVIHGGQTNAPVTVVRIARHPELTDPETGKTMSVETYELERYYEYEHMTGSHVASYYTPGEYSIELWHQGNLLTIQRFNLIKE